MTDREHRHVDATSELVEQHRLADVAAAAVAIGQLVGHPQHPHRVAICRAVGVRRGRRRRVGSGEVAARPQGDAAHESTGERERHARPERRTAAARSRATAAVRAPCAGATSSWCATALGAARRPGMRRCPAGSRGDCARSRRRRASRGAAPDRPPRARSSSRVRHHAQHHVGLFATLDHRSGSEPLVEASGLDDRGPADRHRRAVGEVPELGRCRPGGQRRRARSRARARGPTRDRTRRPPPDRRRRPQSSPPSRTAHDSRRR